MLNQLLSFTSFLSGFGSILVAILILLLTITVHEFGHYIVGKIFKFKINEFAIGMGPAIFKKVKKNGEIFSIRIFPLGGFCAFEGEDEDEESLKKQAEKDLKKADNQPIDENNTLDSAVIEHVNAQGETVEKELEKPSVQNEDLFDDAVQSSVNTVAPKKKLSKDAFNNKKPWQRILVLIAGASVNFLCAVAIIIFNFAVYGHFTFAVNEVRPYEGGTESSAYQEFSLKSEDVIISVNGQFLYLTTDVVNAVNGKKKGEMVDVEIIREGVRQTVSVMLRNDVESSNMTDYAKAFTALGISTVPLITTTSLSPFESNQYFLRFNDKEIYSECQRIYDSESFCKYLSTKSSNDTVGFWITTNDENAENGRKLVSYTLTEGWDAIDKTSTADVFNYFGIETMGISYQAYTTNIKISFGELLYRPWVYAFKTTASTFTAFGELFKGDLPITELSGPIGTISLTSKYVSYGFKYVLEIAAFIGISVAIFNLLPIPALDGARAIFVLIEWIRKKPINRKVEGMIHTIGLFALLGFAVLVDLLKLFF